jgi:glycosyltransferase involved in cell wall biosynthesis
MPDAAERDRYDVMILCANHFQIGLFQNGAGYRYLELALSLGDLGVRAAIACPGPTDFAESPVTVLDQSTMSHADICARADVFIFCLLEDERLVELLKRHGKTLIYDSFLTPVEQLTYPQVLALGDGQRIDAYFHGVVRRHNLFNSLADHFIVGEPEEKLLKLGELISTYRVGCADYRTLADRMSALPVIGYSRHSLPAMSLAPTSETMLWNGGLWNHYGGVDLILDAVAELRARGPRVSFHFLYPDGRMRAHQRLAQRLAAEQPSWITMGTAPGGGPPDFFSKQPLVAGCRAIVLLYDSVLQLHMFLSMRLREVLLFEKPVIVSDFGVLGAFVARHGIGLTIPNTVAGLRDAMERLITDGALYDALVANIRRLKQRYDFALYVPPIAKLITEAATRATVHGGG